MQFRSQLQVTGWTEISGCPDTHSRCATATELRDPQIAISVSVA